MKKIFFTILLFASAIVNAQTKYEKQVTFPQDASLKQKIEMVSNLVPTSAQLAWQELELTAFLHFGMNTFTNNEWGDGKESPAIFNPSQLDAEQWVKALKDGGFKLVIITAKHHDGFCLWPTKTTKHSVASSPWQGGKGDVVRELRKACDKYGMKFGVYLSPWDRNADCYGSDEYNKFFMAQLTELLSNYGRVDEVWFDGACGEGPNGKKQVYDWDAYDALIRKLQPQTVTAIMGTDIRWVGNEGGMGRKTEWSATVKVPSAYANGDKESARLKINNQSQNLGGRDLLAMANAAYWHPSEVDVSIRPGWFYHKKDDKQVKSLAKLVDIYFESVGYNSGLLLNIPPDTRGLIAENDVNRLKEFGKYIKNAFAENLIIGNNTWDGNEGESKEFSLKNESKINVLLFQEDISRGQRMENFLVEAMVAGQWQKIAEATTIGHKRLIRIPEVQTSRIKVTILNSRGTVHLNNIAAYNTQVLSENAQILPLSDVESSKLKLIDMPAAANKIIDGKAQTYWQVDELKNVIIELDKTSEIAGFVYAPVTEGDIEGTIFKYEFYVSEDGQNWTKCNCSGEFSNIMHNPIPQFVQFNTKYKAKFVKFVPLSEIENKQKMSIAELGILL